MARSDRRRRTRSRESPSRPDPRPTRAAPISPPRPLPYDELLLGAAIVAATILAYVPAIRGAFIWDDNLHVTGNGLLWQPGGLGRIWFEPMATPQYYPLVH